ncbi:MAG TPA: pur operon repressor [Clostridia bacterium]|nr:pur operon repressor [Clostridia bacterium]
MNFKRKERIGAITKILADHPNKVFKLNYFTELFDSAKSSISEDIDIVKGIIDSLKMGEIITIVGASGGVKYIPHLHVDDIQELLEDIVNKLNEPSRVIPGDLLYALDILYDPKYLKKIAKIFSLYYAKENIDYVMTVETKGIPLATMTAEALNVPLAIARDENKVTEGATIGINYASGSTGRLRTMYVSKKSIKDHSNILIVDDFLRGGGTAKGMWDLVVELKSKVIGMCFLTEIDTGKEKMISNYDSLIKITKDKNGKSIASVNPDVFRQLENK